MGKRLHDIDTRDYPLTWDTYSELYDRIDTAAKAFAAVDHTDLAGKMDAVRAALYDAWNAVQEKERAEAAELGLSFVGAPPDWKQRAAGSPDRG